MLTNLKVLYLMHFIIQSEFFNFEFYFKLIFIVNCSHFIFLYKNILFIYRNFLVYEVLPCTEFSPLKNSNNVGRDCLSTCQNDLSTNHLKWIQSAGIEIDIKKLETNQIKIFLSPLLTYAGEGLTEENIKKNIINQLASAIQSTKSFNPKHVVISLKDH